MSMFRKGMMGAVLGAVLALGRTPAFGGNGQIESSSAGFHGLGGKRSRVAGKVMGHSHPKGPKGLRYMKMRQRGI